MRLHIDTDAATPAERARAAELLRLIAELFEQPPELLRQRAGELPRELSVDTQPRPHAATESLP